MSNTTYPTAIDTPTNPSTGSTLATVPHHLQHGLENDAIVALETKLGTGTLLQTPTTNGFLIGTGAGASQWQPSPTSPSFTTSILDTNGKTWIGQTPAGASAVNYLNISNSITTVAPSISALGSDNNISLNLVPKGSGAVQDNGTNLIDFRNSFSNFVKTGGVWSIQSGLAGNMTALTLFINGVEYANTLVTGHAFAASSDTYIDYTVGSGITYTAVANNGSCPALAANSVRVAIVITSGAAITSINQGSSTASVPTYTGGGVTCIMSVQDSLGNLIYPTDPTSRTLGYRQDIIGTTESSASPTQMVGLSCPVMVPTGRKLKFTISVDAITAGGVTSPIIQVYDGAVGGTQVGQVRGSTLAAGGYFSIASGSFEISPSSGLHTYNLGASNTGAISTQFAASSTAPNNLIIELA